MGKTSDIAKRIEQHKNDVACSWTRKYRFQNLIKVDKVSSVFDENETVKQLMAEHGINNVRGGSYAQVDLPPSTVEVLEQEMMAAFDRCYLCKQPGHVAAQCPTKKANQQGRINHCLATGKRKSSLIMTEAGRETCLGLTTKGERCKRSSYLNSNGYCPNHRDQCHGQGTPSTPMLKPAPVTVQRKFEPTVLRHDRRHAYSTYEPSCKRLKRVEVQYYRYHEDHSQFDSFESESDDEDTCHRCGRSGHSANQCYAKSDVHGNYLGRY